MWQDCGVNFRLGGSIPPSSIGTDTAMTIKKPASSSVGRFLPLRAKSLSPVSFAQSEFPNNSINHFHEPGVRVMVRLTAFVYDK